MSESEIVSKMEERATDPRMQGAPNAGKDKETDFSLESPKRMQSYNTLILGLLTSIQ